jgi:hypothetical protein
MECKANKKDFLSFVQRLFGMEKFQYKFRLYSNDLCSKIWNLICIYNKIANQPLFPKFEASGVT